MARNIPRRKSSTYSAPSTTSEVLVLSRTKMGSGKICVGGHCFTTRKNVRLLSSTWGRLSETEPYNIGDVYRITYSTKSIPVSFHPIIPPHIEDVSVTHKIKLRTLVNASFMRVIQSLSSPNMHIKDLFEGCLNWQNGKGFLLRGSIPHCGSVQIAKLNHDLVMKESRYQDKVNNVFEHKDTTGNEYDVSYVGCEELGLPLTISANTPIRFSLARFWDKGDGVERSYLQLSGFYR
ncbi:dual OB domain-containing protein [Psychrobacter sp. ANT_H59]|uniref:dual OB domain-containing protein n=1 Tax=Psychrobacter sp. ANT_H59 TaxID=2597354 RepID=UPI0011EDC830|nr:hypothetical protein [Psychrobacter sp. ANT_H59]KAA0939703.1 hypothetical protein FQ083_01535 [Psychrobacter sp. ANT_H59]